MAAQFSLMNGRPHRGLMLWIARAINSLPVPVSPWINTVELVGATRLTPSSTASSAGLLPMSCSNLRGREPCSRHPQSSVGPAVNLLLIAYLPPGLNGRELREHSRPELH